MPMSSSSLECEPILPRAPHLGPFCSVLAWLVMELLAPARAGVTGAGVADTEASSSAADSASYRGIGIDGPRVKSLIDCSVCERTSRLLPHQLSPRRR
jgi:hypothetical protein